MVPAVVILFDLCCVAPLYFSNSIQHRHLLGTFQFPQNQFKLPNPGSDLIVQFQESPINRVINPRNKRRFIAAQVQNKIRYFLRLTHATDRLSFG